MIGKKANAGVKPTAMGIQLTASVYGSAIPSLYGRVRVPMKLIWMTNLRKH